MELKEGDKVVQTAMYWVAWGNSPEDLAAKVQRRIDEDNLSPENGGFVVMRNGVHCDYYQVMYRPAIVSRKVMSFPGDFPEEEGEK